MSVKHLEITAGVIKNVIPGVSVKHLDVIVVLIGATCSWSTDKPSQEEEKELYPPTKACLQSLRKVKWLRFGLFYKHYMGGTIHR